MPCRLLLSYARQNERAVLLHLHHHLEKVVTVNASVQTQSCTLLMNRVTRKLLHQRRLKAHMDLMDQDSCYLHDASMEDTLLLLKHQTVGLLLLLPQERFQI
jgi:hypothetical protein